MVSPDPTDVGRGAVRSKYQLLGVDYRGLSSLLHQVGDFRDFDLFSNCLSFTIVCCSQIVCNCPLSVIPPTCHFSLSVIINYLVDLVSFVCHCPLYFIHHFILFTIVCHIQLSVILHCLSFSIFCHNQWYVIPHFLPFTIVCLELFIHTCPPPPY